MYKRKIMYHIIYGEPVIRKVTVIHEDNKFFFLKNKKIHKESTYEGLFTTWDSAFNALLRKEMELFNSLEKRVEVYKHKVEEIINMGIQYDDERYKRRKELKEGV